MAAEPARSSEWDILFPETPNSAAAPSAKAIRTTTAVGLTFRCPAEFTSLAGAATPRRGRRSIKRAVIFRLSDWSQRPAGSRRIKRSNAAVASSLGKSAKREASCQGSISRRASAETTLSDVPFFSSPIGAKRNSLNSEWGSENGDGRAISVTVCFAERRRKDPVCGTFPRSGTSCCRYAQPGCCQILGQV